MTITSLDPHRVSLLTLRAMLKLESLGMRRSRRPSARAIVCTKLGLPPRTRIDKVRKVYDEWLTQAIPGFTPHTIQEDTRVH